MFHNKFTAMASAFLLAGSVYAGQNQLCPDINDIKAEGLNAAEQISQDIFFSYAMSNYKTSSSWVFVIAPVIAQSTKMAINVANDVLAAMTAPGVPEEYNDEHICTYSTGRQDVLAAAFPAENMISSSKIKQYMQKTR